MIAQHRILTRADYDAVLTELRSRRAGSPNAWLRLIVFRLAACCGLRAGEIVALRMRDVRIASRPAVIWVPGRRSHSSRGREVPIIFDRGTLHDLSVWWEFRTRQGAGPDDLYVVKQSAQSVGNGFDRREVRQRFRTACSCLGTERLRHLTIHDGRHSAISHWLAAGYPLAAVRDWAGHRSLATTSQYVHVVVDDAQLQEIRAIWPAGERDDWPGVVPIENTYAI